MLTVLKHLGMFAAAVIVGAAAGFGGSVAFTYCAYVALSTPDVSPGNDPRVALIFLWAFFLAPGLTLVGAVVGIFLSAANSLRCLIQHLLEIA